jgi:MYXO-CTERM domain-containing protein
VTGLTPTRAEACSPVEQPTVEVLLPAPGAQSVPLNARPVVRLLAGGTATLCRVVPDAELVPVDARVVPLRDGWSALEPTAPLTPATEYTLRTSVDCLDPFLPWIVESYSFTTGEGTDTTAPETPALTAVVPDHYSNTTFSPFCGGYQSTSYAFFRLDMAEPADPEGGTSNLFLQIYEGPTADTVDLTTPARLLPAFGRELTGKLSPDNRRDLAIVVTAVDWAGNVSAFSTPVVAQQHGCGCSSGEAVALPGLAALLGLALGRRTRSRSRSTP